MQFENVDSHRGAPMGRREFTTPPTKPHSVKVFRVNLDSGGYDDGGAYWGLGKPLFCATDGADYRMFVRADSRLAAVAEFRLAPFLLARGIAAEMASLRETARGYIERGLPFRAVYMVQDLEKLGY